MESILTSTKEIAGIVSGHDFFDAQLVMYINSIFLNLKQIGVGPEEGFMIEDDTAVWTDFIPDGTPEENLLRESTKAFMGKKAQMEFDPPANATVNAALQRTIDEYEWRLRLAAEEISYSKEGIQNE